MAPMAIDIHGGTCAYNPIYGIELQSVKTKFFAAMWRKSMQIWSSDIGFHPHEKYFDKQKSWALMG